MLRGNRWTLPVTMTLACACASSACTLTTDEIARALFAGDVAGEAIFQEVIDTGHTSVHVVITAGPAGAHGVQVREPPCDVADAPHFNPEGDATPHGAHRGDLGNVEVDDTGAGELRLSAFERFTVADGTDARDVVGRVVVVLERADDLATSPDGGAGAPLSCGPIVLSD